MNLDKLISEEINKYINESFFEANKKDKSSEKHNTLKSKKKNNKLNKFLHFLRRISEDTFFIFSSAPLQTNQTRSTLFLAVRKRMDTLSPSFGSARETYSLVVSEKRPLTFKTGLIEAIYNCVPFKSFNLSMPMVSRPLCFRISI